MPSPGRPQWATCRCLFFADQLLPFPSTGTAQRYVISKLPVRQWPWPCPNRKQIMSALREFDSASKSVAGVSPFTCTTPQLSTISALCGGDASIATQICATIDVNALGATNAVLQWTVGTIRQQQQAQSELAAGLNTAFVLACAYQVFMMQVRAVSMHCTWGLLGLIGPKLTLGTGTGAAQPGSSVARCIPVRSLCHRVAYQLHVSGQHPAACNFALLLAPARPFFCPQSMHMRSALHGDLYQGLQPGAWE